MAPVFGTAWDSHCFLLNPGDRRLSWKLGRRLRRQTGGMIGPECIGVISIHVLDYSPLQGFHFKHVLMVLDEAQGILPDIHEAIESIRAGERCACRRWVIR